MQIEIIDARPAAAMAQALTRFEAAFRYPLDSGKSFSVSHGDDYGRYYRAMGKGVVIVATDGPERVIGTVGVSLRQLRLSDGSVENSAYIGDLKVSPLVPDRGRVVYRLLIAANRWALSNGAVSGFGILMDDGRPEIPSASTVRALHILNIPTEPAGEANAQNAWLLTQQVQPRAFRKTFNILTHGLCVPLGGKPSMRSAANPLYLTSPNLSACGVLEDTMRARRFYTEDGAEIVSAHLSRFAFSHRHPQEAVELLHTAAAIAGQRGSPALLVALDQSQYAAIANKIAQVRAEVSHAFLYSLKHDLKGSWIVNSTEI